MRRLLKGLNRSARSKQFALVVVSASALFALGCRSGELKPAAGDASQAARGGSLASDNGVELRVILGSWRGSPEVMRFAAPVFVSITNNSGQDIRVEQSQLRLMASGGDIYASVSSTQIGYKIQRSYMGQGRPPELWAYPSQFRTGPSVGAAGTPSPGVAPGTNPAPQGPGAVSAGASSSGMISSPASDHHSVYSPNQNRFDRSRFPEDIYTHALYEGVLRDGETRAGFVFFEPVSRRERNLKLTARFQSVATGKTIAMVAVPMRIQQ